MPKIYSEEFKASALELLDSGMTQKQVCQDLGISKSSLQLWVNHQRAEQHGFVPAENTADRAEQTKMLKRIRELEQENEILRRATAYLSQANLKVGQARPKMMFPLVRDLAAAGVPVAVTCRVLGFSKQAFYQWAVNPVSERDWQEAELLNAAYDIQADDPEFGHRFIADELCAAGHRVSERRVWRLCSQQRIFSATIRRARRMNKKPGPPVCDDRVERDFTATAPNQLWLTDITGHRTAEGKLYACAVKDVFSNRIVGYSIGARMKSHLAVAALNDAVARRGARAVAGCTVHSDRGSQFRSRKYQRMIKVHGLLGSMGRVGAAGDNAAMESFFSTLQKNVLNKRCWSSRDELRREIIYWIERTYHRRRRQRRLGKLTPVEYETVYRTTVALAA